MFGNDPRLPGARNAVPGSQNGVYSGLCLKMTLEVCLKMTPLPVKIGVLFLGMLPLPLTLTTRIITIHTVRIPVNLYFPIRLGREHTNLYSFAQTTAQMDVFPRYFPSSYGGPLPSDVLKCEGPSVTPKRGVRHRSLAIFMEIYADPNAGT